MCATILLPVAFLKLLLKLLYVQYVKRILNKVANSFKENMPKRFLQKILGLRLYNPTLVAQFKLNWLCCHADAFYGF